VPPESTTSVSPDDRMMPLLVCPELTTVLVIFVSFFLPRP
jgi:hypothetical protein